MKSFLILLLICLTYSKEPATSCTLEGSITDDERTLKECRALSVEEGNQCCVVVKAQLGKNFYYCDQFNSTATEDDIKKYIDEDIIERQKKLLPGVLVRAQASCTQDVKPFTFNKCTATETQTNTEEQLGNCTKAEKDTDYCCLFRAQVRETDKVFFCEGVTKEQSKDMETTTTEIDRHYTMHDVEYLRCSPEIIPDPQPDPSIGFHLNFNLVLFAYLFILLF